MVRYCVAFGCKESYQKGNGIQFHRFPLSQPKLLKLWENAVRRKDWKPTIHSHLCSKHFTKDSYEVRPGNIINRLKEDAVPSIFSYNCKITQRPPCKRLSCKSPDVSDGLGGSCSLNQRLMDVGPTDDAAARAGGVDQQFCQSADAGETILLSDSSMHLNSSTSHSSQEDISDSQYPELLLDKSKIVASSNDHLDLNTLEYLTRASSKVASSDNGIVSVLYNKQRSPSPPSNSTTTINDDHNYSCLEDPSSHQKVLLVKDHSKPNEIQGIHQQIIPGKAMPNKSPQHLTSPVIVRCPKQQNQLRVQSENKPVLISVAKQPFVQANAPLKSLQPSSSPQLSKSIQLSAANSPLQQAPTRTNVLTTPARNVSPKFPPVKSFGKQLNSLFQSLPDKKQTFRVSVEIDDQKWSFVMNGSATQITKALAKAQDGFCEELGRAITDSSILRQGAKPQLLDKETDRATTEKPQLLVKETDRASPEKPQLLVKETDRASPEKPQLLVKETDRASPEKPQLLVKETDRATPEKPQLLKEASPPSPSKVTDIIGTGTGIEDLNLSSEVKSNNNNNEASTRRPPATRPVRWFVCRPVPGRPQINSSMGRLTYPRVCGVCHHTYKTRKTFSRHKKIAKTG